MTAADRQPRPPLRIAVLASGRGSNLQAMLDAIAAGVLDAEVVGVFSDRPRAPALERARAAGIDALAFESTRVPHPAGIRCGAVRRQSSARRPTWWSAPATCA